MTSRIGGDSITLTDIPLSVAVAGTYVNGPYATTLAEAEARFPAAKYGHARIDVNGTHADVATVLDVETRDASPATAAVWVQSFRKLHPGMLPVIYCNRSTQPAVLAACGADGLVLGVHFGLWIATLDGTQVTGPGIVACQWKGQQQTGAHYDESLVYDPHIWMPQAPPAPPKVTLAQALAALGILQRYLDGE